MQHYVAIDQIEARAKAINVSLRDIALAAGLHPSTAYRASQGNQDNRRSTERKLSEALVAKEREILKHLIGLHGADDAERAA